LAGVAAAEGGGGIPTTTGRKERGKEAETEREASTELAMGSAAEQQETAGEPFRSDWPAGLSLPTGGQPTSRFGSDVDGERRGCLSIHCDCRWRYAAGDAAGG